MAINEDVVFTKAELEVILRALSDSFSVNNMEYNRNCREKDRVQMEAAFELAEKIDPGITVYFE